MQVWRGVRRVVAVTAVAAALVVPGGTAAHAETTVALRCGKSGQQGVWSTWPYGGYTGSPCASQIDYATTPTGGKFGTVEWYDFFIAYEGTYRVEVWIPCEHANAMMDWEVLTFGTPPYHYDVPIRQSDHPCQWWPVTQYFHTTPAPRGGPLISAHAWSGMVTPGFWMGTDAVRVVRV